MTHTNLPNKLWDRVEKLLDNYAKFTWDGEEMTNYHAFIINEKGSLKFYNGPSFSNSYTKPQFESASSRFSGLTFNTQQISFTIAVYAVTAEEYRKLIHKLHPYTIGNLSFAFDPHWRYVVKLAKIGDSSRYIIGRDENGRDLYYTELQLTFEIQGDAVAIGAEQIDYTINQNESSIIFNMGQRSSNNTNLLRPTTSSEIETPFVFTFGVNMTNNAQPTITLKLLQSGNIVERTMFDLTLTNLSGDNNNTQPYIFEYNSQTGDLCLVDGDKKQILTLLSTYSTGRRIVSKMGTHKILLPGTFDNPSAWNGLQLKLEFVNCTISYQSANGCGINCYARKNLI